MYAGKFAEVREQVKGWLEYVPQTFPHYTRHTVEHSEKIILQLSKLLFEQDDAARPVLDLSAIEAYILCVSALLHDSGMVASDSEKSSIILSGEWATWITEGSGAVRYEAAEAIRSAPKPEDGALRNFLADIQIRYLIAEFVRARHHLRSGDIVRQHELGLGRVAFDDPSLKRTIADVCVAHGLDHAELADEERYPLQRDLRGEKTNVRLLAILLRLADLLDLETDRACPLLLAAASPLPSNSLAHWQQYRSIEHRLTTPQRIEISARCESQEEHRVLTDWCEWIQSETVQARKLLAASSRHADWSPPEARVSPDGTIRIAPSESAAYVPSTWRIDLDAEKVIERLVNDVYGHPLAFVREIIQNAVDATRCRAFLEMQANGQEWPARWQDLPSELRERLAIQVTVEEAPLENPLSGQVDPAQLLIIGDRGIGMDAETIERYFLQIGRSYYQTEDFRRRFRFSPIGRHGIGFMSTFSVSEHVVVETLKHGDQAEPIKITLTGPRTYLLREKSSRSEPGTSVAIRLRKAIDPGALRQAVDSWCRRVEFPIVVLAGGEETRVEPEESGSFVSSEPDLSKANSKWAVTAFPFETGSIAGEVYVFAHEADGVVSWNMRKTALYRYLSRFPLARVPELPGSCLCENGIAYSEERGFRHESCLAIRCDYRGPQTAQRLDRRAQAGPMLHREVRDAVERLLREHLDSSPLAGGDSGWRYKQSLVTDFDLPDFWESCADTLRAFRNGAPVQLSLSAALSETALVTVEDIRSWLSREREDAESRQAQEAVASRAPSDTLSFVSEDMLWVSRTFRGTLEGAFEPVSARLEGPILAVSWALRSSPAPNALSRRSWFLGVEGASSVGYRVELFDSEYGRARLYNSNHPFVAWLQEMKEACSTASYGLNGTVFERLMLHVNEAVGLGAEREMATLEAYLAELRKLPGVPAQLAAPGVSRQDFRQLSPRLH